MPLSGKVEHTASLLLAKLQRKHLLVDIFALCPISPYTEIKIYHGSTYIYLQANENQIPFLTQQMKKGPR